MRLIPFFCFALVACAHLPPTGAPATGETLAVHSENVTHVWTSNDKVGTVQHRDENGKVIGSSEVYEERQHSATVLEWFPAQGESRVDDQDFFNIAGDAAATAEIQQYRNTGITMNRVGLGLLAGGLSLLAGGLATYYAMDTNGGGGFNFGYLLSLAGGIAAGTGGWLTYLGIARENPEVHPVDIGRAEIAAAQYNQVLAQRVVPRGPPPAPELDFSLPPALSNDAPRANPRRVTDAPAKRSKRTAAVRQ